MRHPRCGSPETGLSICRTKEPPVVHHKVWVPIVVHVRCCDSVNLPEKLSRIGRGDIGKCEVSVIPIDQEWLHVSEWMATRTEDHIHPSVKIVINQLRSHHARGNKPRFFSSVLKTSFPSFTYKAVPM